MSEDDKCSIGNTAGMSNADLIIRCVGQGCRTFAAIEECTGVDALRLGAFLLHHHEYEQVRSSAGKPCVRLKNGSSSARSSGESACSQKIRNFVGNGCATFLSIVDGTGCGAKDVSDFVKGNNSYKFGKLSNGDRCVCHVNNTNSGCKLLG